jgi:hypothetical protein
VTAAPVKLKRKTVQGIAYVEKNLYIGDPDGEPFSLHAKENIVVYGEGYTPKLKKGDAIFCGPLRLQGNAYVG